MHYRNGREAVQGDPVIWLQPHGNPVGGMIHTLTAQSNTCNGRLAPTSPNDAYVNLSDCLHVDDVAEAFPVTAKG